MARELHRASREGRRQVATSSAMSAMSTKKISRSVRCLPFRPRGAGLFGINQQGRRRGGDGEEEGVRTMRLRPHRPCLETACGFRGERAGSPVSTTCPCVGCCACAVAGCLRQAAAQEANAGANASAALSAAPAAAVFGLSLRVPSCSARQGAFDCMP
eukprot:6194872-Pleurochrysis_carterae.AAC.4